MISNCKTLTTTKKKSMNKNQFKQILLSLCCLIFIQSLSSLSYSQLTISISEGNDKAITIAVIPFKWNGDTILPEDLTTIIGNDLYLSGSFKNLNKNQLLDLPYKKEDIIFKKWRLLDVSYLITGEVTLSDDLYTTTYKVFDILHQKLILKKQISSSIQDLRTTAHNISDSIYQKITDLPGDFSTHMIYVTSQRTSVNNTSYQLNISDADGQRSRTLFTSKQPLLSPNISHDGKQVAYVSFETGRSTIIVQDINTGERHVLSDAKGVNSSPAFSPDSSKIAFTSSKDGPPNIYIKDITTGVISKITSRYSIDTEPSWMPDGKSIIFTSNRGGSAQIYQLALKQSKTGSITSEGKAHRITFEGKFNARAKVFPSGKSLVLVHKGEKETQYNIALYNLETNRLSILTSSALEDSPSISPNGRRLVYSFQGEKNGQLGIITIDRKISLILPSQLGDVREPVWGN